MGEGEGQGERQAEKEEDTKIHVSRTVSIQKIVHPLKGSDFEMVNKCGQAERTNRQS